MPVTCDKFLGLTGGEQAFSWLESRLLEGCCWEEGQADRDCEEEMGDDSEKEEGGDDRETEEKASMVESIKGSNNPWLSG